MSSSFVHLHNHTEFSLLDGTANPGELTRAAAEMGMPAIAITDHGYLFGAYQFYAAAQSAGIKPILGVEGYMTPRTHRASRSRAVFGDGGRDDVSSGGSYTHMTMWAENNRGRDNLFRLCSLASIDGSELNQKYPRIDRELLQTYGEGLIGTTGCPSGEVQTLLHVGKYDEAVAAAADFRDILGKDNYFVELMDHGLDIERSVKSDLLRLAKDLALPLVATNDLHYVHKHDAATQDALLCINSGSTLDTQGRFKFDGAGYYLKSAEEMRTLFSDLPEACDNTLAIAERCNVTFAPKIGQYMPEFPCPPGEDEVSWFVKEVERGLRFRFPDGIPDDVRQRANHEVEVILAKRFPSYFLVVSDFVRWAKENGVRVGPGRGSGAGSMVAYAMQITDLDPIEHGLLFERFLNPERPSLPDFDIDFDDHRRERVIEYVTRKYGEEYVSQVITYGTMKTKNSLKDAARVLGQPFVAGERLTKALPPTIMGKDIALKDVYDEEAKRYDEASEFRDLLAAEPASKEVFDLAQNLEGLTRGWGVHACAVIMSNTPLMDVIPLMMRKKDRRVITQFDYPTCETIGLLKMDFLGLKNLTIITEAIENIRRNGGVPPEITGKHLDDPATFERFARGETVGVFQLEGGGMRTLLKQMKPDRFADISAVSALYRPGPMGMKSHTRYAARKNGLEEITPIHPELKEALEPILAETYGLIVYQEQVMEIAQRLAGYTLGEADLLRRAMGKKKKEVLDKEFVPFREGMFKRDYSDDAVQAIWKTLLPFADYAFNKSHSAAYGVVSYWTAFLKTHFPAEYMAAVLTASQDDRDSRALYLNECRKMGLRVMPPDVNESTEGFVAVDGKTIRFGLASIKGVGSQIVNNIAAEREENGPYADFFDLIARVRLTNPVVEALIRAGSFDSLGHTRMGLFRIYEDAMDNASYVHKNEAKTGQASLFADDADAQESQRIEVPTEEWDQRLLLNTERETMGLYVSGHPLDGNEELLAKYRNYEVSDILALDPDLIPEKPWDGPDVYLTGLIVEVSHKRTRAKNEAMASFVLEDMSGVIECVAFPRSFAKMGEHLIQDNIVSIKGKVSLDRDGGTLTIFADDARTLV